MTNQKGKTLIMVAILAVVLILGAGFYFIKSQGGNSSTGNYPNQATQPSGQTSQGNTNNAQTSVPAVNSPQDLTTASSNLDSADVDGLNTQLNQNDTDAASF